MLLRVSFLRAMRGPVSDIAYALARVLCDVRYRHGLCCYPFAMRCPVPTETIMSAYALGAGFPVLSSRHGTARTSVCTPEGTLRPPYVAIPPMVLRACAMSGTDAGYGATRCALHVNGVGYAR
eukprot:1183518-Rhodomonas_salina.5